MKLKNFLSLLMVAALCVGFTACSDDDDDNNIPNQVNGTWQYNDLKPVVSAKTAIVETAAKEILQQQLSNFPIPPFAITFNQDGTCDLAATGMEPQQGTYTYSGGKLTIKGGLFLIELGGGDSLTFSVTKVGTSLVLELDMMPILGQMAEFELIKNQLNKLAIAITLNAIYTE